MKYTLAFDVYGTLINTSGVYNLLEELFADKAKLLMESWRNKQLEYSFRRGLMNTYVDFSVCTKAALEYSCKLQRVNINEVDTNRLMDAYKTLPAFEDVTTSLKELKSEDHRLFAFSNGSKNAVQTLLKNAGIDSFFEGIVSVESLKTFKPNPKVYQYFNKVSNSEASNSCLISGNSFDIIGAASYGMHTVWVQRSEESIFDPWEVSPSTTIKTLYELAEKLKKEL